jgi:intracellular proteinase inhibitor BsuPI
MALRISMALRILFAAVWLSGVATAQTEYFPLHQGNQWIYRGTASVQAMEIDGAQTIDGKDYSLLKGAFGGDAWLRMAADGTLYAYDPETKRERPWVAFQTPEGGTFETALDPCNKQGIVRSRNAKLTSPVGDFSGAFEAVYPAANCADAGLDSEIYAPWVGLVQRTGITIAGPRSYDLIYARIGGVTVLSEREVSFGLTVDREVYTHDRQPALMTARLTLRHSQPEPIEIVHGSGQIYDIAIRNEKGEVVYLWSEGKAFTAIYLTARYRAGEKNWVEAIRLADREGKPLPAGKYTVESWLTSNPVQKAWSASVAIEVR